MRARALPIVVALAAPCALLSACILDLDGLTGGGTAGTGGSPMATSSASGGTGGGAGCAVLDCGCVDGPTVIASGQAVGGSPRGVAVTGDGVYWASATGIQLFAAAGSGPALVAGAEGARALAVSGDTLVWTASDGVYACSLSSCVATNRIAPSLAPDSLTDVAFDGQTVAFADLGTGSHDGLFAACDVGACAPISLSSNLYAPAAVTFLGPSAFFVDRGNGNQNGSVARSNKAGQSFSQIAASLDLPSGVAADDTYVYWTDEIPGGHVHRCAYAAGYCDNPEDVAPAAGGLPRPRDIRVGGGRIYWTNRDDGSIQSCPQPGCGAAMPKVHVTGRQGIERLAVGTSCLFWTEDGGGGTVVKAPR